MNLNNYSDTVSTQELSLGQFSFNGLASPDRLVFKNKQRIVIHQLGSGSLATDCLGDNLQSVSFSGTFTGPDATSRARSLDYLRTKGLVLTLAWESLLLPVIIHDLELIYSSSLWITYKLACNVVGSGEVNDLTTVDPIVSSPAAQVSSILNTLQSTLVSPTQSQVAALSQLAILEFDTPPSTAIQVTTGLLREVNGFIDSLGSSPRYPTRSSSASIQSGISDLGDIINIFGEISLLILAKNLILSIVCASYKVND